MRRLKLRNLTICLCLICMLTFIVGMPVKRVEAMATTAGVLATVALGAGACYIAYLALTGAEVAIPNTNIDDWLVDIGNKSMKYGTVNGVISQIYNYVYNGQITVLDDLNITFTRDYLLQYYNYFKDKANIMDIMSYAEPLSIVRPGLPSEYYQGITQIETPYNSIRNDIGYPNGQIYTLGYLETLYTIIAGAGPRAIFVTSENSQYKFYTMNIQDTGTFRNYKYLRTLSNGTTRVTYKAQKLINDIWTDVTNDLDASLYVYGENGIYGYIYPFSASLLRLYSSNGGALDITGNYPIFPDLDIYDSTTGEIIEGGEPVSVDVVDSPYWPADTDPDDSDFKPPVVPYVQLPSNNNWGFNLGDLIQEIINRVGQVITASAIGDLINQFKQSLSGSSDDNSFSYYSDNDNNYYTYYYNTYWDNDSTNYNINISREQTVIPVDLNTISQYTDNTYIDVIKEHAINASNTFAEYVVFWHNVDPELVYACFGCLIVILLGAFVGKWGHS